MRHFISIFSVCCVLWGCNSETESKGIREVVNFFGGKASFSKGINASTNQKEPQGEYYAINLQNDDIFKYYQDTSVPAGKIAYTLYEAFSDEERRSYDFIRVIISDNIKSVKYDFETRDIEAVRNSMPRINAIIKWIQAKEYQNIIDSCSPTLKEVNLGKVRTLFTKVDGMYGDPKEFVFQGFSFWHVDVNGKDKALLKLSGMIKRDKMDTNFNISIDPFASKQYLYGFEFAK